MASLLVRIRDITNASTHIRSPPIPTRSLAHPYALSLRGIFTMPKTGPDHHRKDASPATGNASQFGRNRIPPYSQVAIPDSSEDANRAALGLSVGPPRRRESFHRGENSSLPPFFGLSRGLGPLHRETSFHMHHPPPFDFLDRETSVSPTPSIAAFHRDTSSVPPPYLDAIQGHMSANPPPPYPDAVQHETSTSLSPSSGTFRRETNYSPPPLSTATGMPFADVVIAFLNAKQYMRLACRDGDLWISKDDVDLSMTRPQDLHPPHAIETFLGKLSLVSRDEVRQLMFADGRQPRTLPAYLNCLRRIDRFHEADRMNAKALKYQCDYLEVAAFDDASLPSLIKGMFLQARVKLHTVPAAAYHRLDKEHSEHGDDSDEA